MKWSKQIDMGDKIFEDDRGWVINPLDAVNLSRKQLGNLHVVSLLPGKIRGNHYHTNSKEWLLVCGGPALIAWRLPDKKSMRKIIIEGNEPALFEIPPKTEHAVINTSSNVIYLLAFSNSDDPETLSCTSLFESINDSD